MKHMNPSKWLLGLALLAGAFGLLMGCESDKDTNVDGLDVYFEEHPYVTDPRDNPNGIVTLKPLSAQITFIGQTITFQAVGGKEPYIWDVVYADRGHVASRSEDQGIYTSTTLEPNTIICFDGAGHSGVAQISASGTNTPVTTLTVLPASANLAAFGDSVSLTASGGTAPYYWSVTDLSLGNVSAGVGSTVVYTRSFSGNNIVSVTDSASNTKQVPITQP